MAWAGDRQDVAPFGQSVLVKRISLRDLMAWLYLSNSGDMVETTNPRDKVFALLGLVKDTMGLEHNYQFSVEHVYTITAASFILSGNAALLSVPRSIASKLKVPSWVLDWSAVPKYPNRWSQFNASGFTEPEAVYPLPHHLRKPDVEFQADPEVPVSGAWSATSVGDFSEQGLARRISLRGFRLDSVAMLGLVANDHFDVQLEDSDTIRVETENIKREVNTLWTSDHNPELEDDPGAGLDVFFRYFCRLRSWLSNILAFAEDDKEALPKTLDILLHSGNTVRDKHGRYSSLRGRITSADDLMDPRNWILDTSERSALVSHVYHLADGCRIFRSAEGRFGYVPIGAVPGDVIVILFGVPAPLVVRPGDNGCFTIVGPAYVSGVMRGEAVPEASRSEVFIFE